MNEATIDATNDQLGNQNGGGEPQTNPIMLKYLEMLKAKEQRKFKYVVTSKSVHKKSGDVILQKVYFYEKPAEQNIYPPGHKHYTTYEELP